MCIFLIFKILIYFCSCYDEMINEKNDPFFRFPFFALKTDMEWTEDTEPMCRHKFRQPA